MLVSVDVLLTEAPMSGDRTRFYRTCEKIRSSPHIEIGEIQEAIFEEKFVKRSDPEKNPKRYPEQKRGKEPLTEERRIYRSLV